MDTEIKLIEFIHFFQEKVFLNKTGIKEEVLMINKLSPNVTYDIYVSAVPSLDPDQSFSHNVINCSVTSLSLKQGW